MLRPLQRQTVGARKRGETARRRGPPTLHHVRARLLHDIVAFRRRFRPVTPHHDTGSHSNLYDIVQ